MTPSEEIPAGPVQPAPAAPVGHDPAAAAAAAAPVPPIAQPAPAYTAEFGAPGFPLPGPDEQAAEAKAAKKAKRRTVFAKSAVLAVPALALVALLVGTGLESSSLSNKYSAASTAAKAANVAGGLAAQLHAAQSAADASILVDPGCEAVESKATANELDKFYADTTKLLDAENGNSASAFFSAINKYIDDMQSLSTSLQQDAALSSRPSVKAAVSAVTSDLGVVIAFMQDALAGNYSTSKQDHADAATNRMDADGTALDTVCGGSTLGDTAGSSSGGTGTTSA
jgi:hypothetical protein